MNNAFFYIHPKKRKAFLGKIYNHLEEHGIFYILDEPDFSKKEKLKMGRKMNFLTNLFPVYQVNLGGFFNKPAETEQISLDVGYKKLERMDSWCDYRSHFLLYK